MAKLFKQMMRRIGLQNAPTPPGGAGSGGSGVTINRDPKQVQVKRIGYQLSNGSGGSGRDNFEGPAADLTLIATAIERDSYLTQAVMRYRELIFKSGYHFKGKNEQALDYLRLRLEMIAIATLIPTEELFQGIGDDIVRYANSFIVKARAKKGVGLPPGVTALAVLPAKDPIAGYFRLPPQTITVARDANGTVLSYKQEVQGQGDALVFKPEDMIHIAVNRPAGQAFGSPWAAPMIDDIRLLRKVEENAALLLYRHIFPLLAYTVGLDKPGWESSPEEITELQTVISDMPTDGAIVLPERHKIEAVNINTMDVRPLMDYFENRVFTGMGMSAVDMGRGDTANRNTADSMSGMKVDRVKGWQQQIQVQIDKFMIEELLLEGGFDPMANPDFNVDFVFNEIEQEMRIKMDTHEIFKFEHNLQTWEETRKNMGSDPVADESRLYFQMIGMQQAEHQASLDQAAAAAAAGSASTDNKQQPSNQHGTRSGPKKSTEWSYSEQYYQEKYPAIGFFRYVGPINERKAPDAKWEVDLQESVFTRYPSERVEELQAGIEAIYSDIESDVVSEMKRAQDRKAFPMTESNTLLSSIHFGKDKMVQQVQKAANGALGEGIKEAMKDAKRNRLASIDSSLAMRVVSESSKKSFDTTEKLLHSMLSEKLENLDDPVEAMLRVKGVFQSLRYRNALLCRTLIAKTFNYGYVLAMVRYGESEVYAEYTEGSCPTCLEKSQAPIDLSRLSSLDEMTIFDQIPPWHPNCDCPLTLGGR
ncbi:hypothetical protein GZH47_32795 (plasmid) [Paenibacillus rhizovicinus]|uniref:Phage portal protein n=1 Tax=Paenibacillus rhizovicinus TaxID=2704463 RepID=A0A6C0PAX7_9BACL|nr:hypothetical protein [Paenibacillus rhizovicinus]QHW35678.1 hypothetical protein GZH47_32795 [Paenibacillus rhizovicinus]